MHRPRRAALQALAALAKQQAAAGTLATVLRAVLAAILAGSSAETLAATPPAAPVLVPDTLAQRLQPCMACHGPEGRASREGYLPRIAGKPAAYLYQQLLNFRDGRRSNAAMAGLLAHQRNAYLREMAGYFAALDLPYPGAAQTTALPASPAELARGAQLAREGDRARRLPACSACHGNALGGTLPAVPGLLGLPRDYLIAQLGAWQTGQRHATAPDCMAEMSRRLAPGDASAVATWLAAQPVPVGLKAAAPSAASGAGSSAGPAPLACGSIERPAR